MALGWYGAGLIYTRGSTVGGGLAGAPGPCGSRARRSRDPGRAKGRVAGFAAGKAIFDANCAGCHPGGQNIVYPKLPIKGSKRLAGLTAFEAFRDPTMPDGSAGGMPPFGTDMLTAARVKDLYAYASTAFK